MCVYMCMYVCSVRVHVYVHVHMYTCACTCACIHVRMHMYMYTCARIHLHVHMCTCVSLKWLCCFEHSHVTASLPVYSGMMMGLADSINSPSHWTKAKVCVHCSGPLFPFPHYFSSPDTTLSHGQGTCCNAKYM